MDWMQISEFSEPAFHLNIFKEDWSLSIFPRLWKFQMYGSDPRIPQSWSQLLKVLGGIIQRNDWLNPLSKLSLITMIVCPLKFVFSYLIKIKWSTAYFRTSSKADFHGKIWLPFLKSKVPWRCLAKLNGLVAPPPMIVPTDAVIWKAIHLECNLYQSVKVFYSVMKVQ